MESFLAAITGHRGDDATAKAQDAMYEAWERTNSRSRIALARKALDISPLCADAEGDAPVSMVHGLGP
jgi:hypothetical protein